MRIPELQRSSSPFISTTEKPVLSRKYELAQMQAESFAKIGSNLQQAGASFLSGVVSLEKRQQAEIEAKEKVRIHYEKLKKANDDAKAFSLYNSAKSVLDERVVELTARKQGNARGITAEIEDFIPKIISMENNPPDNEEQRAKYEELILPYISSIKNSVYKYELQERDSELIQETNSAIKNAIQMAGEDSLNLTKTNDARLLIAKAINTQLNNTGNIGAETVKATALSYLSKLHETVIANAALQNPVYAREYFKVFSSEIVPTNYPSIEAQLAKGDELKTKKEYEQQIKTQGDEILGNTKTEEEALSKARGIQDAQLSKDILSYVRQFWVDKNRIDEAKQHTLDDNAKKAEEQVMRKATNFISEKAGNRVNAVAYIRNLPDDIDKNDLYRVADYYFPTAKEEKKSSDILRKLEIQQDIDKGKFQTEVEVIIEAGGSLNNNDLEDVVRYFKTGGIVRGLNISDVIRNWEVLRTERYNPNKEEDRVKLNHLFEYVTQEVRRTGVSPSDDSLRKIIGEGIQNYKALKKSFFGYTTETEVPRFELPFVVISDSLKNKIKRYLELQNKPVSDENIRKVYVNFTEARFTEKDLDDTILKLEKEER